MNAVDESKNEKIIYSTTNIINGRSCEGRGRVI